MRRRAWGGRAPTLAAPLAAPLAALLAAALVASLAACGGAPKTPVDHEGLRDRADQETDQL